MRPLLSAAALATCAAVARAQVPSGDTLRAVLDAHRVLLRFGAVAGEAVWPGYRPDTIPLLVVFPERGTLLLGWPAALPESFASLPGVPEAAWRPAAERGAASTGTTLGGRLAAQLVVHELAPAPLLELAAHEVFHAFQQSVRREGARFGQGESSFLVSSYPVFDATNEAGMALEGRLLRAALEARPDAEARRLAQQFLAVRESRQRRLESEYAEFETLAELNEGLAEYALVRAIAFAAADPTLTWSGEAAARARARRAELDTLTADATRSLRLRFYATGPAIALLLDRLAGGGWQARLVEQNLTLQEALASATGYREGEAALAGAAGGRFQLDSLSAESAARVAAMRAVRARQIDSLLARPGVEVVIETGTLPAGDVGLCGIDPQNLLQADQGVLLHTRWLRACAGRALDAVFNTPVVHDRNRKLLRAAIGAGDAVQRTVGGAAVPLASLSGRAGAEDVRIESPALTLRAARAPAPFLRRHPHTFVHVERRNGTG